MRPRSSSFPVFAVLLLLTSLAAWVFARPDHGDTTAPVAGSPLSGESRLLGAGSELLQREGPIRSIHAHLCGFHFYSGEMQRVVRAEHYCTHLNEEVYQCVLYDSPAPDARLIGVEYVISERLFNELPPEEKALWHSHRHEVMSGQLVAPGLPSAAEKKLMAQLVTTYGKTWHFWQVDRGDTLPLGTPKLMMGFTADGQIPPAVVAARDESLGIDSRTIRAERKDLPTRPVAPGADAWQTGPAFQIKDPESPSSPGPSGPAR